jgi:hypothetical protein
MTFEMKYMGEARKCLGLEIFRSRTAGILTVSQPEYANMVLARYDMAEAYGAKTPMECGIDLNDSSELAKDVPYREAIGSLMYLMVGTRPDIAFAVSQLSKYVESPTLLQWNAVKRVMRYIKKTLNHGLSYTSSSNFEIEGYCDSDWAGERLTRKLTPGHIFCLAGAAISWCSKRQSIVALSSTEAEYVGLCSASKEAVWLRRIMRHIGIGYGMGMKPIKIYADNQGSIKIANSCTTKRSKHIDLQFHFTRSVIESGEIALEYCPTSMMMADMLTKALARVKVEEFNRMAGILEDRG